MCDTRQHAIRTFRALVSKLWVKLGKEKFLKKVESLLLRCKSIKVKNDICGVLFSFLSKRFAPGVYFCV